MILLEQNYHGFEEFLDLVGDVSECVKTLPGEYSGTICVKIEYLPTGDKK